MNFPHSAYVALGSNLNNPTKQLSEAIERLKALPNCHFEKCSDFYLNPAMGDLPQPDYVNAVAMLRTSLTPQKLLQDLQAIEQLQGRVRSTIRWLPRTLDLDLLLFDNRQIEEPDLTLPHPGLCHRAFVIIPLAQIAPNLLLPNGVLINDWQYQFHDQRLRKLELQNHLSVS